ncbi:MAG: hypothetical protein GC178_15160 [Flavobacteriales bacterium]|nr:hypothetical protein [Flavobacteriales bacterium]
MKILPLYLLGVIFFLASCKKNENIDIPEQDPYYLEKWTGDYDGISHHFKRAHNGDSIQTWSQTKHVTVNVLKSSVDSSLNVFVSYNDTLTSSYFDLKLPVSGAYSSQSGSGSGYRELSLQFGSDSIDYYLYEACGVWCETTVQFALQKN